MYAECVYETSQNYQLNVQEVIAILEKDERTSNIRELLQGDFVPGNLRVGGVNLRPRKYASYGDYLQVPIISLGPAPYKDLSPFFLGPVTYREDGEIKTSSNVENHFQMHKLYETVDKKRLTSGTGERREVTWQWPAQVHAIRVPPNTEGSYKHPHGQGWWKPTKEFWAWRSYGLQHHYAVRRPNGKAIPIGSLYDGKLLDLIDSRKIVYEPAYRQTAYASPTFWKILKMLYEGRRLLILDLDGPKIDLYPNGIVADYEDLTLGVSVVSEVDPEGKTRYKPYGHAYVLCKMLLELLGN